MFEEDFIKGPVEVDIEGRKFLLRPLTGEEIDEAANKYIYTTSEGTYAIDLKVKNQELIKRCVVDAPYEVDGKKFKDLNPDKRLEVIQGLRPHLRAQIIGHLNSINFMPESDKKKSEKNGSQTRNQE